MSLVFLLVLVKRGFVKNAHVFLEYFVSIFSFSDVRHLCPEMHTVTKSDLTKIHKTMRFGQSGKFDEISRRM